MRLLCKCLCAEFFNHYCAMSTLKERMIEAREAIGLSQAELAKRAHCGQTTVASIENGRNKGSTPLPMIAFVLGVEALWLVEGKGPKRRDDWDKLQAAVDAELTAKLAKIPSADVNMNKLQRLMQSMPSDMRAKVAQIVSTLAADCEAPVKANAVV